jgi:hypothetical protein
MPNLDYTSAHKFVKEQRRLGNNVRWDGWDMVFWKPTRHGFTTAQKNVGSVSTNGSFDRNKGRWGVESRIAVDGNGVWKVPSKNVKSSR